jgi:hypothetical protein
MIVEEFEQLNLRKFKMKDIVPDATVLLIGRRRSGKSLMKGEKVLMFNGNIKKVEEIKVGDLVMGDDSTPRTVWETHHGTDTMYKVTNRHGESYTVNSHHILSLIYTAKKNLRERKDKCSYQVTWFDKNECKLAYKSFSYKNKEKEVVYEKAKRFLDELIDDRKIDIPILDYIKLPQKYKNNLLGYQVPIEFPEKELPIDPYMIGYWLGDGTAHNSDLSGQKGNLFLQTLKDLNLINNKHIPHIYKCNSRENRLKLLAGFIDADGHLGKRNDFEITQYKKHETLLDDIIYLAQSLGFTATKHIKKTSWTHNGEKKNGEAYKININGTGIEEIPTLIERKRADADPRKPRVDALVSQIQVEDVGLGEYYGIELDGNNRFVLGNFIVTHNSFLVRDIFYHHKDIPKGVIFSGTEEASPFFSNFIPDIFIHSEYDPGLIDNVLKNQRKKIRESKDLGKSESGKTKENNFYIVLDDLLHDASSWKKDKTIKNIFFNGRHYNLLFILTMQYPLGITPELRSNIDYVFIFNEPSVKNRKKIYEDYCSIIPSFDHFCNILDTCTQNYECLVVKTSGQSNKLKDQLFWYKAEPHTNFRVGHPKLWKYHNDNYNDQYEFQNEQVDQEVQRLKEKYGKTKKLKVFVNREGDIVGHENESE